MNLFATKVRGGRVMLTLKRPSVQEIDYTEHLDAFPVPGEPIAVQHLCPDGFRTAIRTSSTGKDLRPLIPTRVRITIEVLDKNLLIPATEV